MTAKPPWFPQRRTHTGCLSHAHLHLGDGVLTPWLCWDSEGRSTKSRKKIVGAALRGEDAVAAAPPCPKPRGALTNPNRAQTARFHHLLHKRHRMQSGLGDLSSPPAPPPLNERNANKPAASAPRAQPCSDDCPMNVFPGSVRCPAHGFASSR